MKLKNKNDKRFKELVDLDIKLNKIYNHIHRIENKKINISCDELLKDIKKDNELDSQSKWEIIEILENHKLDNNFNTLLINIRNYFI
jgi:hypothetical protein